MTTCVVFSFSKIFNNNHFSVNRLVYVAFLMTTVSPLSVQRLSETTGLGIKTTERLVARDGRFLPLFGIIGGLPGVFAQLGITLVRETPAKAIVQVGGKASETDNYTKHVESLERQIDGILTSTGPHSIQKREARPSLQNHEFPSQNFVLNVRDARQLPALSFLYKLSQNPTYQALFEQKE